MRTSAPGPAGATPAVRALFLAGLLLILPSVSGPADGSELGADPANAAYVIDGDSFTLRDGVAKKASAPGSASQIEVRLLGTPVSGDVDGDGRDDAVVWLTVQGGGSGTFYYVAAALRRGDGFRGTKAFFIGDRVGAGRLSVRNGGVKAHYRDRKPSESFATAPSIEASTDLTLGWFGSPALAGFVTDEEIAVAEPAPGNRAASPLRVRGQAVGSWFAEGEVSLELRDETGRSIAKGFASAQGPWMTQDLVPFDGTMPFAATGKERKAWLVVKRNNPSDRRDLDREIRIPVILP